MKEIEERAKKRFFPKESKTYNLNPTRSTPVSFFHVSLPSQLLFHKPPTPDPVVSSIDNPANAHVSKGPVRREG